jgi:hypothetical protein
MVSQQGLRSDDSALGVGRKTQLEFGSLLMSMETMNPST